METIKVKVTKTTSEEIEVDIKVPSYWKIKESFWTKIIRLTPDYIYTILIQPKNIPFSIDRTKLVNYNINSINWGDAMTITAQDYNVYIDEFTSKLATYKTQ